MYDRFEDPEGLDIKISNAANTMTPAWLVLLEKGFEISKSTIGGTLYFVPTKEDCTFLADDPVTVLGLISLFEARGEDWKASDPEIDAFMAFVED